MRPGDDSLARRDCYEVLGVARGASLDEIKKAYRKRALECHPDRNPGNKQAEEQFKEATEAYSVLSDPDQRRKYDQYGWGAFEQGAGAGPFGGFGFGGDFSEFEDIFGDLFSSFFGGTSGRRSTRGRAGRDLRYDLEISFEEAAFGAEKRIQVARRVLCDECEGSGAARGSSPETCPQCRGAGQVGIQQGFFTIARTCNVCGGAGRVVKNPCKTCSGRGLKEVQSEINVKIPPGIDNGQRLKLRGEGEAGMQGGPSGDLYVQIAVQAHPVFERNEADLICEVPISYAVAALGAEIDVPTLEGETKLKIPPGTPSGKVFRLRGKGIQVLGSNRRGDEHVRVFVAVPRKVSDKHREILEKLREIEEKEGAHFARGIFEKVKDIFS